MDPETPPRERAARPTARDLAVGAGLFALGAALTAAGVTGTWSDAPWRVPPAGSLLPLAVCCAASALHRRAPLTALGVAAAAFAADGLTGGSLGVTLAFVDVLYQACLRTTPARRNAVERTALAVVVGCALVAGALGWDVRSVVLLAVTGAGLLCLPVWWARDVVRGEELARLAGERAALETERAVREERAAMARDLHDVVAGHVAGIALQSEAALAAARARGEDTAVLAGIRAAGVEALGEMRTMIHLMREGTAPDPVAAAGDLRAVVELARAGGLDVRWAGSGAAGGAVDVEDLEDLEDASPVVRQALHRVLQEALTNARRHAGPGPVEVALVREGERVVLRVVSALPGRAAGADGRRGHGLATMRERAEALGGTFRAGPAGPGSWEVRAELPGRPAVGVGVRV
ncbi:histidine kinase [Paenibacillus sp. TRM 82003]|uniref:sensor histidine kinase n=1 Tax=Kineococcus sp. TRM81007 TaxID=2925831 RepID=UPI001F579B48|nr:histidine kinase [Kineococcus sp. TRM81007]MCI2237560.1 histidine kinase [Kineococcus sp. TRM81007]MCI3921868.1 histidine kinase [Paenibacillus sp. TRM 82003]